VAAITIMTTGTGTTMSITMATSTAMPISTRIGMATDQATQQQNR
jgi:hypothetical protein